MPGSFKHENIAQLAFCPEMTQDLPNWKMQVASGVASPPSIVAPMGAALPGFHNGNVDPQQNNDDHYNGLFAYCKTGSNAGQIRKVSDYSCPVGAAPQNATFLLDAAAPGEPVDLPSVPGAGETWYLFAPLPAKGVSPTMDIEKLPREYETLTFDPPPFVAGLLTGGISFETEVFGLEQPRNAATGSGSVDPDRIGHLLQGLGQRVVGAGSAVIAGPSTNTRIYVGSNSGYTTSRIPEAGKSNVVQVQGTGPTFRGSAVDEIRRVTVLGNDASGDYIEVTPNLSNIPNVAAEVFACETFIPAETGHRSHTFLHLKDDQIFEFIGCLISVAGTWNYGQLTMLQVDSQGSTWAIYDADSWDGVQSYKNPVPVLEGSAFFVEALGPVASDSALPMTEFGFDYAVERTIQKVTTGQTMKISGRVPVLNCKFADVDGDLKQSTTQYSELQGSEGFFLAQAGIAGGESVALLAYGQIESMPLSPQDGIMYWDASLKHVDGDRASVPYKMLICRF